VLGDSPRSLCRASSLVHAATHVQEIICTSRLAQALALFDSNSEQWCKVKRVLGAAHSLTTTEAWYTLMSDFHI